VISITVTQTNDVGTFGGDLSGSGDEDAGDITGTATFTDAIDGFSAPFTFALNADANDGTAIIDQNGNWTYTPDANFNGSDSFTIEVTDDDGNVETQIINITVNQTNDAGTFGGALSGSGAEDGGAIIGTATFADAIDGYTPDNFAINTGASNGTASILANGDWTYTPNADFNGSDSFIIEVTDDAGNVETQVISITVTQTDDAGTFGGDLSGSGDEDAGDITGTATFTDAIDGFSAPFTFALNADANDGTAIIDQNGNWTYTPDANFNGSDSFTIEVTDDDGNVETQVINITVDPVPDIATLSIAAGANGTMEGTSATLTEYTFTVTRSGDLSAVTTVDWAVSSATMNAADFFGGLPSGSLTFGIGVTTRTITIKVNADSLVEVDESFTVTLSDPAPTSSTTISVDTATGTVDNDDQTLISIDDVTKQEGGTFTFTISLTAAAEKDITLLLNTADGTALAVEDYDAVVGDLITIPAGATKKEFTVNVIDDDFVENPESFFVNLSDALLDGVSDPAAVDFAVGGDQAVGEILDGNTDNIVRGTGLDDTFVFTVSTDYLVKVNGVEFHLDPLFVNEIFVHGFAGIDQITLNGGTDNESAKIYPSSVTMSTSSYTIAADSVETITVNAGTGNDVATLYDSPGNDNFSGYPTYSRMVGAGYDNYAYGFDTVFGRATAGDSGGVGDRAFLYDSAGNDNFYGRPTYSRMVGSGFNNYATGFDTVYGRATAGDAGGVGDQAFLYDSTGNDRFYGRPTYSRMLGSNFSNFASGFDKVLAYASAGDSGGVGDRAFLYDSDGNDRFYGRPTYSYLVGNGFFNRAKGFDAVYANATAGGVNDRAFLYDSAGNDSFYAYPTYSYLTGNDFYNQANGFKTVTGYATAGDAGGVGDQAFLYDSAGNDRFYGRPTYSRMVGTGFNNYASGFDAVYAYASTDAGGVGDRAYLYDSLGDDTFFGRINYGTLSGSGFLNFAEGFDSIRADGNAGGSDTLDVDGSIVYALTHTGWENII
jgi:VCBS repeat-containing protein